jgi:hypothetical protein
VIHAHTEPLPFRQKATRPVFPSALVISGLEHAHVLDQKALAQVLTEKRIVLGGHSTKETFPLKSGGPAGTRRGRERLDNRSTAFDDTEGDYNGVWNVPEGFITIYVCPWNPRERPSIHKTLVCLLRSLQFSLLIIRQLDKFAMSTTILVHNNVRQAMRTLPFSLGYAILHPHMHSLSHPHPSTPRVSPLPRSRTPPLATSSVSGSHFHHLHGYRHSHLTALPSVEKQLLPTEFLRALHTICQHTHIAPRLSIYSADLFSAARHHPQLDGTFLTVTAMQDAEDLARASRVLGMDPTGSELVRNLDNTYTEEDEDDEQSTESNYEDAIDDIDNGSIAFDTTANGTEPNSEVQNRHEVEPKPLYVSEADIARIVPRVITHRLRVRNGPQDEVLSGAVFGATMNNGRDDTESVYDTRLTVKDILVGILGDV